MKRIIWLVAIFAVCAESRFSISISDRQWLPSDARQNCTDRCEIECTTCLTPNVCTSDETKCGEHPPDIGPDCPPDEICVPKPCLCKRYIISLRCRV